MIRLHRAVIGGRLLHNRTGHPLAGLTVTTEVNLPTGLRHTAGTAVSGVGGRFAVFPGPDGQEALIFAGGLRRLTPGFRVMTQLC